MKTWVCSMCLRDGEETKSIGGIRDKPTPCARCGKEYLSQDLHCVWRAATGAMTLAEFVDQVLTVFPEATVEPDNDGQLVIYTNLKLTADESVITFEDVPFVEEDLFS